MSYVPWNLPLKICAKCAFIYNVMFILKTLGKSNSTVQLTGYSHLPHYLSPDGVSASSLLLLLSEIQHLHSQVHTCLQFSVFISHSSRIADVRNAN